MDKLEPVIKHIFWILFGIALILPTAGWWMGTGDLQARISEQESKIDGAFNSIPPVSNPNQTWTDQLQVFNEQDQKRYDIAAMMLRRRQQDLRTWHSSIAPYMRDIEFWGDIPQTPKNVYKLTSYWAEIQNLKKILNPLDPQTGKGVMIVNDDAIPQLPSNNWDYLTPSPEEIWRLQEDIWLYRGLLDSVASVNDGYTAIADAPIKQLVQVSLHGGDRSQRVAGTIGGSGGGQMDSEGNSGFNTNFGGRTKKIDGDIKLDEEFGPVSSKSSGSDGEGSGMTTGGSRSGNMSAQILNEDRYIDEADGMPFKTRGFKLTVVMDHRKLPDLLVELTNCVWPGQIVRVHQVDYNSDQIAGSTGRRSGPRGFGFGGDAAAAEMGAGDFTTDDLGADGGLSQPGGNRPPVNAGESAASAMADPYNATIIVAGLLTIYKPLTAEELAAYDQGQGAPAGAAPAVDPSGIDSETPAQPEFDPNGAQPEPNGSETENPADAGSDAGGSEAPMGVSNENNGVIPNPPDNSVN